MRPSRGALLPPLPPGRLRRRGLYHALRSAVVDGVLGAGERLPSSRQAAADCGVSRGLFEEVYAQLVEEGFLEREVGRGTFVARELARIVPLTPRARGSRPSPRASRRGVALVSDASCREPEHPMPFDGGIADTRDFPWRTWQRLQARASRELGAESLSFADPRGLRPLRLAVARYLAQFRGIRCHADQVVVFGSAQHAIYALSVLLLDPGQSVWMEDPGYPGARAAFRLAGARVVPVGVDPDGLRVRDGRRAAPGARLAYVTASHQYPTGVAMSPERRAELLDWAMGGDAWVVEDDYDGEFRYDGPPLPTLASLDPQARVIYVGTLSKAMFISLRLAFAVVPEKLVEPLATLRTQLDGFTPPLAQMTMSLFMDEGHFPTHLRRMRQTYAMKREALVEGLAPLRARGWSWPAHPAGLHLLIRHPDRRRVRAIAGRSTLRLATLGPYRVRPGRDDGLFLRYGSLGIEAIRSGAETLVREIRRTDRRSS